MLETSGCCQQKKIFVFVEVFKGVVKRGVVPNLTTLFSKLLIKGGVLKGLFSLKKNLYFNLKCSEKCLLFLLELCHFQVTNYFKK